MGKVNIASFLLITLLSSQALGQNITLTQIDPGKIPVALKQSGKIINAVSWTDKFGENILLAEELGPTSHAKSEMEGRDAAVHVLHAITKGNSFEETWNVYDSVVDCPVDIEANFIEKAFQVTELNNDGIGEVWIMYTMSCKSGVGPSEVKIVMVQGRQKYTMTGESRYMKSQTEMAGGGYKFDSAFLQGPKAFRDFAKKVWGNNL